MNAGFMFSECLTVSEAQQVFERLIHPTERAWTSFLLFCIDREKWQLALSFQHQMQEASVLPSHYTFLPLLKACSKLKDVQRCKLLHARISHLGYENELHVCRSLVGAYAKCGSLAEAHEAFHNLPVKNAVSWNALISSYAVYGPQQHAIRCFEQMKSEGTIPNAVTIASVIKLCGSMGAYGKGREIHLMFVHDDCQLGLSVGNTLIAMYAKSGSLVEAKEVFDSLTARDIVSWTALISGYAEHGSAEEALQRFHCMQVEEMVPNDVTFSCVLKACGNLGDMEKGQEVHMNVVQEEYETHLSVGNSLIGMYAKCGSMAEAQDVFDELSTRDVVSWTALIAGYSEKGPGQEALEYFDKMQLEGIPPDSVTYACSLKAVAGTGSIERGSLLHLDIIKDGFEENLSIGNTLIAMYAKCARLLEAEDVFCSLSARSVVSWTALISGYAEHGFGEDVLKCFQKMHLEGFSPNDITYCCVLKACGITGAIDKGKEIHMEISQRGLEGDLSLGKTLVGMYTKGGLLSKAQDVFNKLVTQDVMSWTAMVAGYAEHGSGHDALKCMEQMQQAHICANAITYICAVKACGSIGALIKSQELHMEIIGKGFENDTSVANSLISTYAKCCSFKEAWSIFHKSTVQDVITWCSIIQGYAVNQNVKMALHCFDRMRKQGVMPDDITFVCILNACSQSCMFPEAYKYFKEMEDTFGIVPSIEHYSCITDLIARSGYLYEAEHFIEIISPAPEVTWTTLLNACKMYGDEEVGLRCFQQLVELNPEDGTWYVIMSDIYLSVGKWDDASRIEEMRKRAHADKKPAIALMELNNRIHEFAVGSNQDTRNSVTMCNLWRRMKMDGYISDLDLSKIQFT